MASISLRTLNSVAFQVNQKLQACAEEWNASCSVRVAALRPAVRCHRVFALWLDAQEGGLEFNRNSQAFRAEGE